MDYRLLLAFVLMFSVIGWMSISSVNAAKSTAGFVPATMSFVVGGRTVQQYSQAFVPRSKCGFSTPLAVNIPNQGMLVGNFHVQCRGR
jgi:hypothetical protein